MDDEPKDGGPTYPVQDFLDKYGHSGLSIRDWFAGQALAGYLVDISSRPANREAMCFECYKIADEMLKVRQGEK